MAAVRRRVQARRIDTICLVAGGYRTIVADPAVAANQCRTAQTVSGVNERVATIGQRNKVLLQSISPR